MKAPNESKFNMWRATLPLVKLDGVITPEEENWLKNFFNKVPFSPEQLAIIKTDMDKNTKIEEIIPLITDKVDRATLLHFANMIFKSDKDFHEKEQAFYDKFKASIMGNLNLEEIVSSLPQESSGDSSIVKSAYDTLYKIIF